jgi:osmotically-inducible protein OsmY
MQQQSRLSTPLLVAAIAALALAACSNQRDERSAGQKVNAAIAKVERQAEQVKPAEAVSDASIISSVNAEFARDGKLDPATIDVDAARGRVALRGTAPDAEAVARARQIALSIKGVTGVDNYLTVRAKS